MIAQIFSKSLHCKLISSTLFVIIITSLLARSNYAITHLGRGDTTEFFFLLVLREIFYILAAFFSLLLIFKSRKKTIILSFLFSFILIIALRDSLNNNIDNFAYGIRILIIILASYSAYFIFSEQKNASICILIWTFLLISVPISIYQVLNFQPYFGTTIFGTRANGVFFNPIVFSINIAAISVFLYYSKVEYKFILLIICFLLCLLSGGRAGIIVSFLALFLFIITARKYSKISLISIFLIPILFLISSAPDLSGREGTQARFNDARIDKWKEVTANNFTSLDKFLIGTGLGDGTNAANRSNINSEISDSAFVVLFRSFGALGLTVYLFFLFLIYIKYRADSILLLTAIFIFSLAQSLIEMHPAFIIIISSLGLLKSTHLQPKQEPSKLDLP